MRAMLNDASLVLEFWDEAVTADAYLRNKTNTGPIIDRKITSPEGAWTGVTPSIDYIRVWGRKCYSYINPKTISAGQRHDKLVNTGRIGVFVGYTSTTKQLRVYSPELGYTFRASKVLIDEKVKGGSIDLQLRNCISGPQGTLNVMPDRKPRGRPRKEIPGITPSALARSMPALPDVQSTSQIVTPAFIPPPDVPKLNQNSMNNEDNTVNCEDIASPNAPLYPTQSKTSETEIKSPSSPVLLPSRPVPIVEEVQQDLSGEDGAKP
jgi:hypothetical protein